MRSITAITGQFQPSDFVATLFAFLNKKTQCNRNVNIFFQCSSY